MSTGTQAQNIGTQAVHGRYIFDNAAQQSGSRFSALADFFDPGTIRHLRELGVRPGWRCLEIGAGGGSIATWLADEVGTAGHVVATDIDTRFLSALRRPNLEVHRHDIVADSLPGSAFDLVHARLVLLHLPERERAIDRMVAALKPDGVLLAEEFDTLTLRTDPLIDPAETPLKSYQAIQATMIKRGADPRFGRLLPARLRAHGLLDITAEARAFMWLNHPAAASLFRANIEQMRSEIVAAGLVSEEEVERDLARLQSCEFVMPSPTMWAVSARRP
jgi:SAM-dependent methyltransferase